MEGGGGKAKNAENKKAEEMIDAHNHGHGAEEGEEQEARLRFITKRELEDPKTRNGNWGKRGEHCFFFFPTNF